MTDERLLRLREVARQTGYSGTTIYRLIRGGRFPAQVKLAGGGRVGLASERGLGVDRGARSEARRVMGRVLPLSPTQDAERPDKAFATVRAEAALRDACLYRTDDDRGEETFVVSWRAWTKEFRQLSDVSRFIETLPRLVRR